MIKAILNKTYFLKSESEITYNSKIKMYPNGIDKISVFNRRVYKKKGFEKANYVISDRPSKYITDGQSRANNLQAVKNKVFDIAYINNFKYFVTLTFDPKKVKDRYNDNEIKRLLLNWLKNSVTRKDLKYLLIPERHKDGAIHCHALISGRLKFFDSGIINNYGKPIYNISDWKYGFSTAFEITDNNNEKAFIKYITKYITKDCKKIFGNYYLAGGKDLKRNVPYKLENIDYDSINTKEYSVPDTDLKVKFIEKESEVLKLCQKLQTIV